MLYNYNVYLIVFIIIYNNYKIAWPIVSLFISVNNSVQQISFPMRF